MRPATALAIASLMALPLVEAQARDAFQFRLLDLGNHFVKWSNTELGRGATVTYAIVATPMQFPNTRNCGAIVPVDDLLSNSAVSVGKFYEEVTAAFSMWEAVANIKFREIADATSAGIVIGAQANPVGRAFANVTSLDADGPVRQIERALVCLNPRARWKIGFDGNLDAYDLRYTLAHEIGHAIGLDHPHPSGSLMSYRYEERFRELQPGDIDGAIAIYGARQFSGRTTNAFAR